MMILMTAKGLTYTPTRSFYSNSIGHSRIIRPHSGKNLADLSIRGAGQGTFSVAASSSGAGAVARRPKRNGGL
jgi:hypothetical protein